MLWPAIHIKSSCVAHVASHYSSDNRDEAKSSLVDRSRVAGLLWIKCMAFQYLHNSPANFCSFDTAMNLFHVWLTSHQCELGSNKDGE